ncbi:MAG TPA: YbhB/YbcL family Raf kinase inhibitor-like protein [Chitinophagaceae bacterium]|nr:YbhB/YbcL family Raf kinase inhibitor-like protein [Chitinophagaceae bacterium]
MEDIKTRTLVIASAAFRHEGIIPSVYTCDGKGINPPLEIDHIPVETQTLAIIMEDPDAPNGTYDHWLLWNISPIYHIRENSIPGISGTNSAGKTGYHGPCPPSGSHRYYFYVFALDTKLDLEAGADKKALQEAMEPHILAKGILMGRYQRNK